MVTRTVYTDLKEHDVINKTWANYRIHPENKENIDKLMAWNPDCKKGVILSGLPGTGKTHALKAIINQHANRDFKCKFVTFADVLNKIKDNEFKNSDQILAELIERDLLILDDVGAEKVSDWVKEILFIIFEKRMNSHKLTFMSTNLNKKEFEILYDKRLYSRLAETMKFFAFKGIDYRIEVLAKQNDW